MSMFENPSAGKFGPPPENARREQEHERAGKPSTTWKEFFLTALALIGLGLALAPRTRGWIGASLVLLSVLVFVAQHVVGRQVRDERGGTEPSSPWNRITR
jgi:hypothetical protein